MKDAIRHGVALVMSCAIVTAGLVANGRAGEATAESSGLGLTQGQFLLQVIHVVHGERFFEGPVTAVDASQKLSQIGLAPEGGWRVNQALTREQLGGAYEHLMATRVPTPVATEGEAKTAAAPAVDASGMTVAELIDRITEAVGKAFEKVDTERVPVSPSGWHWK